MKKLCITYQMETNHETAENCIITSFTEEIANKLLDKQVPYRVEIWLNNLAKLQGYKIARFCLAEERPACDDTNL